MTAPPASVAAAPAAAHAAGRATASVRESMRRLRHPPSLSIRWRLTIWYTVVLALTLGVFSLIVYWWLGNSLMRDYDSLSEERAMQVEERLARWLREQRATALGVIDPVQTRQLREQGVLVNSFDPFRTPGVGVRVWDNHASLIDASEELRDTPRLRDYQPVIAALQGNVYRYRLETDEGSFYSYSYPALVQNGRPLAVIQILTSLASYRATMERLGRMLALGTLLVSAIAFVTGAALAQTALRPIDAITVTAQRINRAPDLGRRIPLNGPRDEIHRLTETINEMLDRIEGMFARQRQFMADVSHELRTPLTTVCGELELMQRSGHADAEGLDAARAESERMSRLVGDLLLLARADQARDVERAPVEMETLVLEVLRHAQRLAGDVRTVALAHADGAIVVGDRDRLKQALLNLVGNALTHTPPGTHVTLALRREPGGVRIDVTDNGPGIPREHLEHIFERFYRVDKARSRSRGGTGLGLAIVDWIAGAHGGRVDVSSTVGSGTTFTLHLPLAPSEPARPGAIGPGAAPIAQGS